LRAVKALRPPASARPLPNDQWRLTWPRELRNFSNKSNNDPGDLLSKPTAAAAAAATAVAAAAAQNGNDLITILPLADRKRAPARRIFNQTCAKASYLGGAQWALTLRAKLKQPPLSSCNDSMQRLQGSLAFRAPLASMQLAGRPEVWRARNSSGSYID